MASGTLIFQTRALKVQNRGGGYPTKMMRREVKTGNPIRPTVTVRQKMVAAKRVKGSDYVVFICPRCGTRNKKCVYQAKGQTQDGRLSFKCHTCYHEIEVQRPVGQDLRDKKPPSSITTPEGFKPGTLLGPDGKPIGG